MVSKNRKTHFGHESMHTHSQTLESNVAGMSKATAEILLESKGHDVVSVRPADTIHRVTEIMKEHKIGCVVVRDQNGHLAGILTERDIVMRFADLPDDTFSKCAEEVMTRNVVTATPETPALEILNRMSQGHFRHMPVMEGEHIAGLISIGDVVKYRLRELEYEALKLKQMIVG